MAAQRARFRFVAALVSAVAAVVVAVALAAPWLYAEFGLVWDGPRVGPRPQVPALGRWIDEYWLLERIAPGTWAIGEPRYYQGNVSYLLEGEARALLFDAGSGLRDIVPVVRQLTALPVTVIASHLHFDHVGALGRLDRTALPDLPALRARAADGRLALARYEYLGFVDELPARRIRVDEWWEPGRRIDLGGRSVELLHLPGHTPESVAVLEAARDVLYAGDFIYPSTLYAFLPGASRAAYAASVERLLARIGPTTVIYAAHPEDGAATLRAPALHKGDVEALRDTLRAIAAGRAAGEGLYPRVYPVRGPISFATGAPWNNR